MADYGVTDRFTGGTPTASQAHAAYPIANAFDDNTGTLWFQSTGDYPKWAKYDFGAGVAWKISKITILNAATQVINAFNIQGSNNDSDYTTLYSGNCSDDGNLQTFNFTTDNKTAYRYILIDITSCYNAGPTFQVYEFQAFEGIYPSGGILNWFFSEAWKKHDKLWRNNKLYLPKDLGFSH